MSVTSYLREQQKLIQQDQRAQTSEEHEKVHQMRQAFASTHEALVQKTQHLLQNQDGFLSWHDAWVMAFSEKRTARGYSTQMTVQGLVMTEDGTSTGVCDTQVSVQTPRGLRALVHKELYDVVIDTQNQALGFLYWDEGFLRSIATPYTSLTLMHDRAQTYEQLFLKQCAQQPFLESTLTLHTDDRVYAFPARWHQNGAVLMEQDGTWKPYRAGASSVEGVEGNVHKAIVDSGLEGIQGDLMDNVEDRPNAPYKIIKSYFRQQSKKRACR